MEDRRLGTGDSLRLVRRQGLPGGNKSILASIDLRDWPDGLPVVAGRNLLRRRAKAPAAHVPLRPDRKRLSLRRKFVWPPVPSAV